MLQGDPKDFLLLASWGTDVCRGWCLPCRALTMLGWPGVSPGSAPSLQALLLLPAQVPALCHSPQGIQKPCEGDKGTRENVAVTRELPSLSPCWRTGAGRRCEGGGKEGSKEPQ